jgi:hypothetical protein
MCPRIYCILLAAVLVALGFGCGDGSVGTVTGDAAPDSIGCGVATCPTGCCDAAGHCHAGTDANACGAAGDACVDCTGLGLTACDASRHACYKALDSCAGDNCLGCCAENLCYPGVDALACGSGGQACQACGSGLACLAQACAEPCGPTNCEGCCANNVCVGGSAPAACGSAGVTCVDCTATGTTCSSDGGSGGTCQSAGSWCSPTTCPSGCCDANGVCQVGSVEDACGNHGASCQTCPAGWQCGGQACYSPCTPETCPSGCCDDHTVPTTCLPGTFRTACGTGGRGCLACPAGTFCSNQTCMFQPPCDCPGGCCDALGQCYPGTSNTQCGAGGQCEDCTQTGEQCSIQACTANDGEPCNADTCPSGCCDETGDCQQGLTGIACGTGAVACQNCLGSGEICVNQVCALSDGGVPCDCPYGCCDPSGNCYGYGDAFCGQSCIDCTQFGGTCSNTKEGGECVLADGGLSCMATCSGCCDPQGNCRTGLASDACGGPRECARIARSSTHPRRAI